MEYVFENCVSKCIVESIEVKYSKAFEDRVTLYAKKMATAKLKEKHHKFDCYNEEKRISTGLLGEAALEEILKLDIIDWSIGDSADYHYPDVPGYRVGIKTVEYGKFPIIFKKNYYPQIICILNRESRIVNICGLATVEVLNKYQNDDLVLSPVLKARGTKTGFYGFDYLQKLKGIDDLKYYKK